MQSLFFVKDCTPVFSPKLNDVECISILISAEVRWHQTKSNQTLTPPSLTVAPVVKLRDHDLGAPPFLAEVPTPGTFHLALQSGTQVGLNR